MFFILALFIGYPSFSSGSGTFILYSARTLPMANLSVNLHLSDALHKYKDDSVTHHLGLSKIGLGYGITDYVEFYLGTTLYMKGNRINGFDPPEDSYFFGDKDIYGGLKFYFPVVQGEGFSVKWLMGGNIGADVSAFPRPDRDDSLCINQHFEPTLRHKKDIQFDFLNDIEMYPLYLHLNLGYEIRGNTREIPTYSSSGIPDSAYFLHKERSNLFRWGSGIEIAAGPWTRFILEAKGTIPAEDKNISDTLIGSFGLRFITPAQLTFDLGVDYALSDIDFVPDWEKTPPSSYYEQFGRWKFKFGFTTTNSLVYKKKKPEKGIIALTVRDIETDEPLDAIVTFKDTTLGVYKTGDDGSVDITLHPGVFHIKIARADYISREASLTVKSDAEVKINTVLRREKKPTGTFTGTITSYRDKKPLAATIELLGTKIKPITSDPEKGIFKGDLPQGTYNIKVSSEGYISETFPIEIKQGQTTIKNVRLIEELVEKKKLVLYGIHFDTGKSTIRPDGYPILDDVVEVLKANKEVTIEISGHTDAVGSSSYNQGLSDARAQSVRRYLVQHGISTSRLVARGYGESNPIASNTTRTGRAQNRRIEFTVISK